MLVCVKVLNRNKLFKIEEMVQKEHFSKEHFKRTRKFDFKESSKKKAKKTGMERKVGTNMDINIWSLLYMF